MTNNELRITTATHAIQTGVKMTLDIDIAAGKDIPHLLKHIRTGIDANFATGLGLAELLISKGVFTLEEYLEFVAEAYEKEVARYEAELSKRMGANVKLG